MTMFKKILIANRGDQRQCRAAAQLNRLAREACAGGFNAKVTHV
jgi:biotin carboxylase